MNVMRSGERIPHVAEVTPLVQMVSPFAPHIAEELWSVLGNSASIFDTRWPSYDEALTVEDRITMAVQVNGKTRGTITVPRDVTQDQAMEAAMLDLSIGKFVTGAPRKVIFVPGRMLNIVM
jgi:leucyl-tRNA synthetase